MQISRESLKSSNLLLNILIVTSSISLSTLALANSSSQTFSRNSDIIFASGSNSDNLPKNDSKFEAKAENCFSQESVLIHKGQSKSRRNGKVVLNDCYFCVTEFGHTEKEAKDENFYAVAITSFKHGNDKPDPITVKVTPNKPETLSGKGPNGKDEMVVFLDLNKLDLYTAKAYNLKWFHRGHFDTYRCENLKLFKDLTEPPTETKTK